MNTKRDRVTRCLEIHDLRLLDASLTTIARIKSRLAQSVERQTLRKSLLDSEELSECRGFDPHVGSCFLTLYQRPFVSECDLTDMLARSGTFFFLHLNTDTSVGAIDHADLVLLFFPR